MRAVTALFDFPPTRKSVDLTRSAGIPWGIGTAFGALALAFVVYLVGAESVATVGVIAFGKNVLTRDTVAVSIIGYQFLALGVALCVGWLIMRRKHAGLDAVGLRFPGAFALVRALLSLAPIFLGVALISGAFATFFPGYHLQGNAKQELPVGSHVSLARAVIILAWAAVEAPLVEEVLFRGIIFQGLTRFAARRVNEHLSVLFGAVASGAVFGLAHFEPHTLPILIYLGIALAYVFYYSRSIYASALVHGTVNAIAAISVLHGA